MQFWCINFGPDKTVKKSRVVFCYLFIATVLSTYTQWRRQKSFRGGGDGKKIEKQQKRPKYSAIKPLYLLHL